MYSMHGIDVCHEKLCLEFADELCFELFRHVRLAMHALRCCWDRYHMRKRQKVAVEKKERALARFGLYVCNYFTCSWYSCFLIPGQ
jgi:hypothetical protein